MFSETYKINAYLLQKIEKKQKNSKEIRFIETLKSYVIVKFFYYIYEQTWYHI